MSAGAFTSIPDVIDYLVAQIRALPACAAPVQVTDGWAGTFLAPQMVCVGGGPEDDEQSSLRDFAVFGGGPNNLQEDYGIPLYVRCWQGGTDFKPARDQAFTIYKAIEAFVRADPALGGNIFRGYPTHVTSLVLIQKHDTRGRAAEITFLVSVKHRY